MRPRTSEIYEGQLRHIVAVFADVHLCDVHPVDVRTWHGRLSASGLHHNTVAKIYRLFRSIMTTAVDDGLIARNPVRIKGASAERMIERPLLTWDDVRALAGAIHPRFECLVWTAAASGLRFGELAGLTIEHVNLERRELRVIASAARHQGPGPDARPTEDRERRADRAGRRVDRDSAGGSHRAVRRGRRAGARSCSRRSEAARCSTPTSPRSGRRRGTPSVCATSASTTSATSPAPKRQPRAPRSERSCRSWATRRAPPASATSRPPSTASREIADAIGRRMDGSA